MFKVEIYNLQGILTHGGQFSSLSEAEAWIAEHEKRNSWGKLERLVPTSECSADELANQVLETIPAIGVEGDIDFVPEMKRLKKTFTVEIIDITSEVEQHRINQESLQFLQSTDWLITREVETGIPCPIEIKQARSEARAKIIR